MVEIRYNTGENFIQKTPAVLSTPWGMATERANSLMHPNHNTSTKICTQCGQEKPATANYFHIGKRHKDGLRSKCKVCRCENQRLWRQANCEQARESSRRWDKENPDKKLERDYRWRKTNPKKKPARDVVYRAIRVGKLPSTSSQFCFICGTSSDQGARMEYHHVTYDKPLEVFPLCSQCHSDWHKGNGTVE